ncbi:hypothetical protein [Sphingomonas sp. Root710]|uniref:hypothetical protein n=1 Tax=Sphingomonas sp. Root710 TaxID=1736594 RepID=UPI0012E3B4D6|nr:hypothetical protein [Sphingomonas sp. Root710]
MAFDTCCQIREAGALKHRYACVPHRTGLNFSVILQAMNCRTGSIAGRNQTLARRFAKIDDALSRQGASCRTIGGKVLRLRIFAQGRVGINTTDEPRRWSCVG